LRAHPAHWIALGFGSGLSPVAPGTVGTLWAWLAWAVLGLWLTPAQLGWLLAVSLPLAWWACAVSADHLNVADPSAVVADEVVAFWLVLWLVLPASFWAQLAAFALFRFFDAVKPGPWAGPTRLLHGARGWRGLRHRAGRPGGRRLHPAGDRPGAAAMTGSLSNQELLRRMQAGQRPKSLKNWPPCARGWMLATAESCTGGLIAGACTDLAGSSHWFERGFVSHSNAAKTELLGVPAELIAQHGAVSEPVARAMARGAVAHARAQVAVAVTGVAGPAAAAPTSRWAPCGSAGSCRVAPRPNAGV
jgi:phosphatidylglycerophosphatase A